MEVTLRIKEWQLERDEKTKVPKIVGMYEIVVGDKTIAQQSFNTQYSDKKMAFSESLMKDIAAIDKKMQAEVEKMVT